MLIVTRKLNQSIVIGKKANIVVSILENSKKYIKLGISAPKEVPIHREEIHQRIEQEKKTKEEQYMV